ncbi:MAG: ADP-ribosylglycohydrolase family protein [Candidatus Obscuribacterales bacterium]|nr:ADP-ribosylglycohydrolase family protein [Candidatus Obscuribacterales bacterium]
MAELTESEFEDRLAGVLLGTALGDALGLICEGLNKEQIKRRFGKIGDFHLLPGHGYFSDDTEQSALLAQALAKHPDDVRACCRDFQRALFAWLLRMPYGVGLATISSCFRIALFMERSGVKSAGNGSAMRAAIIGVYFHELPEKRKLFSIKIAETTHTDPRAVAASLFVADLAAASMNKKNDRIMDCFLDSIDSVEENTLKARLLKAAELAEARADTATALLELKCSGFVLHSVPLAVFCFLRFGDGDISDALGEIISAGGDTDSNAAILGAWLGARHGAAALPGSLINRLDDGPFGPTHLRKLAHCLSQIRKGEKPLLPTYNFLSAFLRNLWVLCIILIQIVIRILCRIYELLTGVR